MINTGRLKADQEGYEDELLNEIKGYDEKILGESFKDKTPEEIKNILDKYLSLATNESEEDFSAKYLEVKNYLSDVILLNDELNKKDGLPRLSELDRDLVAIAHLFKDRKDESEDKIKMLQAYINDSLENGLGSKKLTEQDIETARKELKGETHLDLIANEFISIGKQLIKPVIDDPNHKCHDLYKNYFKVDDKISCDGKDGEAFNIISGEIEDMMKDFIDKNTKEEVLLLDTKEERACNQKLRSKIKVKKKTSYFEISIKDRDLAKFGKIKIFMEEKVRRDKKDKDDEDEDEDEDEDDEESENAGEDVVKVKRTKKYITTTYKTKSKRFQKLPNRRYNVTLRCQGENDSSPLKIKTIRVSKCTSTKCLTDFYKANNGQAAPPPQFPNPLEPQSFMPFIWSY